MTHVYVFTYIHTVGMQQKKPAGGRFFLVVVKTLKCVFTTSVFTTLLVSLLLVSLLPKKTCRLQVEPFARKHHLAFSVSVGLF